MSSDMTATNVRSGGLALPESLRRQLDAFRRTVWTIKAIEAVCGALFGVLVAWLVLFLLDRVSDTPAAVRWTLFAAAVASCAAIPVAFHRWIWSHRGLDRLARLIARRFPSLGDQLLGIVEIVRNQSEQQRSRALCEAAIRQVAESAGRYDLREAVPRPRHRLWAWLAAVPLALAVTLPLFVPAAAANAWARFLSPWRLVERFTFTRVDRLPETLVIPHGEQAEVDVGLRADSQWRPDRARARIGGGAAMTADRDGDRYRLSLPPQVTEAPLRLAVGDARQQVKLTPTFRPEIKSIAASVQLPEYLGRREPLTKDVRGGVLAVVKGSTAVVTATANRELAAATIDGERVKPAGATISTLPLLVDQSRDVTIEWQDSLGLSGSKPLVVSVASRDDEPPTIAVDGLAGRAVLLETETVRFGLVARDDFGVKRVGIEWIGSGSGPAAMAGQGDRTRGVRLLAAGGPEAETLEAVGTFSPAPLGITPQTVEVRAFAEDYLPGRDRIYSAPAVFLVMGSADHALWINDQIARWKQQTAEVRDREMELLARNEELQELSADELDAPENRKAIREQAAAEKNNGRRLGRLADSGAELVRQALRNPEFDAGTLEQLAQNVQDLKEMAESRMPGVGELLQDAAEASKGDGASDGKPGEGKPGEGKPGEGKPGEGKPGEGKPGEGKPGEGKPGEGKPGEGKPGEGKNAKPGESAGPSAQEPPDIVGEQRGGGSKPEGAGQPEESPLPPTPQVVDSEASDYQPDEQGETPDKEGAAGGGAGKLGLPKTTVGNLPQKPGGGSAEKKAQKKMLDEAVEKQRQLIEDFAKISQQLSDVMSRLEGTTFVKRLKAAARSELKVGEGLASVVSQAFGKPAKQVASDPLRRQVDAAAKGNDEVGQKLSAVMDDLDAYSERRPLPALRTVLDEMKELDLLGSLRQLTDEMKREAGTSIAQTEFWSDTLDRWADELVPPPQDGGGDGSGGDGPPPESLPPEVVLEAMLILEAETNLREETRVAEQVRPTLDAEAFKARADGLAAAQQKLAERVGGIVEKLDMPDGPPRFDEEIRLFEQAEAVMAEARGILAGPDTGRRAIAAETEAIELLLQSQFGGGGGGGGGGGSGGSPGGGGTGGTRNAALARLGEGVNSQARAEAPEEEQAIGKSGSVLPDEFRDGLDAYFNAFERGRDATRSTP
jgi:hypothetical protein